MGLVDLMTSEAMSPSGRPLRPAAKGKACLSSSAGNLSRSSTGDNDAYIAQVIVKDQDRQQKQAASEMRRLGVELREVSLPPTSRRRANTHTVCWCNVLLGCEVNNANPVQMWLAKVRQEEYDKKESRLGVIDKRQRSQTNVRVRQREYRKARYAAVNNPISGIQRIKDRCGWSI